MDSENIPSNVPLWLRGRPQVCCTCGAPLVHGPFHSGCQTCDAWMFKRVTPASTPFIQLCD